MKKTMRFFLFVGSVSSWAVIFSPCYGAEPFIAYDLGVGGDQHYPENAIRYFTNIVASTAGYVDGDQNLDIVLLANAIPANGDYRKQPNVSPQFPIFHHYRNVDLYAHPSYQIVFSNSGDYLNSNAVRSAAGAFDIANNSFAFPDSAVFKAATYRFAPPSPNVVLGMVRGYTGSDVAWLQGDGRGHFRLRLITPGGNPVKIRMGFDVKLMDIDNDSDNDILLISGTDIQRNSFKATNFPDKTILEPFSGAGRLMWLENKNNGATFDEHLVAEYNYDRPPVAFYTVSQRSPLEIIAVPTFYPRTMMLFDATGDNRPDIVIANNTDADQYGLCAAPASSLTYSDVADFSGYDLRVPRPAIGDKWTNYTNSSTEATNPASLLVFPLSSSAPHISTSTYQDGHLHNSTTRFAPDMSTGGDDYVPASSALVRLGSGEQALAMNSPEDKVRIYRRKMNGNNNLSIVLGQYNELTNSDIGNGSEVSPLLAADLMNEGKDILIVPHFACYPTGCRQYLRFFDVAASNNNDLTVSMKNVSVGGTSYFSPPNGVNNEPFVVHPVDVNKDGKIDLIIPNQAINSKACSIFINNSSDSDLRFKDPIIVGPKITKDVRNHFAQVGTYSNYPLTGLNDHENITSGDFNGDGFIDFTVMGPARPATMFLNNLPGMQRARVTIQVKQADGSLISPKKTWSAIVGGGLTSAGQPEIPADGGDIIGQGSGQQ